MVCLAGAPGLWVFRGRGLTWLLGGAPAKDRTHCCT